MALNQSLKVAPALWASTGCAKARRLVCVSSMNGMKRFRVIFGLLPCVVFGAESVCHGTTSDGRLENGVELPRSGPNFVTYSNVARIAGRTYVHSEVSEIIVAAYAELEKELPNKVYKYAETGFEEGGEFKPHKTHRNGLSVDFMTPVKSRQGASVLLPTYPWNKFGYSIEFDERGRFEDLMIDYDALAAHIVALDRAAKSRDHKIWRVIFDPELQAGLFNTRYGDYIQSNIALSKKRSWVRHDEHYHVDFVVPCEK